MTFVPTVFGSGVAGYAFLKRTRDDQQALFERNPLTTRETTQFAERLKDIQTSEQLMDDRTLLKVALGAFGLDEDLGNRAFIKKILDSDLENDDSFANRLADKRYLALAEAFNFAGEGGAKLIEDQTADELTVQLQGLQTADDLLSDRGLLRASLEKFGLEGNISNTYFLKQVLESDLSDENSFANRMPDARLVEFAETFGFFQKEQDKSNLDSIIDMFGDNFEDINTADKLLDDSEKLEKALELFDLEDIYTSGFLKDVLESNLDDDASFANTLDDERFVLFAAAFNFNTPILDDLGNPAIDDAGDPLFKQGTLEALVEATVANTTVLDTPEGVLEADTILNASLDLFGIPRTFSSKQVVERVLNSDPESSIASVNVLSAEPYSALYNLFNFKEPDTTRTYPQGFVEQVTRNYLDRQFEIQVGDSDPTMRVALSLERELTLLVEAGTSNDSKWFSIMASPPLRQAFEGAFRLPASFGSIDVDQQLSVLKSRAESFFDTNQVDEFLDPERLDDLRQAYLLSSNAQGFETASSANIASLILANF